MKKLSKLSALIMVMLLAFSLVGCGDNSDKVLGTWETSFDLADAMLDGTGDEYADFDAEFIVNMRLAFEEGGTYRMYLEEESAKANFEQWLDALVDYETEMVYAAYEEQGFSREEVDEQAQQQYGCSMRDYILEDRQGVFDIDGFIAEIDTSGVYQAKGDKLYLGDEEISPTTYDLFTLEGDTLTLNAATGEIAEEAALVPGFEYPYVFTKVE